MYDDSRRIELLGIDGDYKSGGIEHFSDLTHETLETLINEGYIELDMRQNYSPSTEEFYKFMVDHPDITAHGYAVSPIRDDCRITIEGLSGDVVDDLDTIYAFYDFCNSADTISIVGGLYSWWD